MMGGKYERRENLLFAIDHLADAAHYAREGGETNVADVLGDIIGQIAAQINVLSDDMQREDARDAHDLTREYEMAL